MHAKETGNMKISRTLCFLILCCSLVSTACAAKRALPAEASASGLKACPDRPNCVSSDAIDEQHGIAPLTYTIPAEKAWQLLVKQVVQLPRTKIVAQRPDYLHAECRSAVFGFIDDLEFRLLAGQGEIAVRSAARSGYYDFGVNRRRIEDLRTALGNAGVEVRGLSL
jgi:uncharacterized protein (DUF1499 family)